MKFRQTNNFRFLALVSTLALATYFLHTPNTPKALRTSPTLHASLAVHNLSPTAHLHCFIYDRPPRTGSSTASAALQPCLARLGFREPVYKHAQEANFQVRRLFETVEGPFRALTTKHVHIVPSDARLIRSQCKSLFYVTNARPARQRVWSRIKYNLQKMRFSSNGSSSTPNTLNKQNTTLTVAEYEKARELAGNDRFPRDEELIEWHPYLDTDGKRVDIARSERFVADYVLRNDGVHFDDDLTRLLRVLGCGSSFTTANVHKNVHSADEEIVSGIKLKFGDVNYKRLMELGNRGNEEGLRRARAWVQDIGLGEGV